MKGLIRSSRNILMEICQHGYLGAPSIDEDDSKLPIDEQHKRLIAGSGKLVFLKLLLPKLKERGHRVLLFSQFKVALNCIEDFLIGEGFKYLRLDGDIQQSERQKDMDKFNAPDSDYFIYLLTTRAGGVGINLATADTVIIFDPDFNPHQDLQAIARSHRYGQKKKVLVFKLMTKNSCEEKIVQAGKKKMVLDHLVVQSIDVEHEEGDLDSVLLHGTAALYEKEVDGVSASDVVYNSKNVDEMIDRVEKEAEDMAEAMAEKDRLEAEAEARGEVVAGQSKEAKSFGFAKIWEADQNGLKEVDEDDEGPDDGEIHRIIAQAHQDRLRREKEEAEKNGIRYRQAKAGMSNQPDLGAYLSDGEGGNDASQTKDGKKGKKAGMRKKGEQSSDDEFAPVNIDSDSDASDDLQGEAEAFIGEDGMPHLVGEVSLSSATRGLAAPGPMPVKKRKYNKHGLNGNGGGTNAEAGPSNAAGNSVNGVAVMNGAEPVIMKPGQVAAMLDNGLPRGPDGHAANKASKNAAKAHERRKLMGATAVTQQRAGLVAAQSARSGKSVPAESARHPLARFDKASRSTTSMDQLTPAEALAFGRYCVYWMYHVLRQFGYVKELNHWARAALLELDPRKRKQYYEVAAVKVDVQLEKTGSKKFFTVPFHRDAVYALIDSKLEWIDGYGDVAMQAYPLEPAESAAAGGVERARQIEMAGGGIADAGPSGSGAAPDGTASLPAGQSGDEPAAPAAKSAAILAPRSAEAGPSRTVKDLSRSASTMPAETKQCLMCDSSSHTYLDCPNKVDIVTMRDYVRDTVIPAAESADRTATIQRIASLVEIRRKAGDAIPAELEELARLPVREMQASTEEADGADRMEVDVAIKIASEQKSGGADALVTDVVCETSKAVAATPATSPHPEAVATTINFDDHHNQPPDEPTAFDTASNIDPPIASTADQKPARPPSETDSPPKKRPRPNPLDLRLSSSTSSAPNGNDDHAAASYQPAQTMSQRSRASIGFGLGTQKDAFMLIDSDDEQPATPVAPQASAAIDPEPKSERTGLTERREGTPELAADLPIPAGPSTLIPAGEVGQDDGPHDHEDGTHTPPIASQASRRPRAGSNASSRPNHTPRGRRKQFKGCLICMSAYSHAAVDCPSVRAGSQSIRHAMMRFLPSDALYDILKDFMVKAKESERQKAEADAEAAARDRSAQRVTATGASASEEALCAFCQEMCGLSTRACAEAHGGRPALKRLIRQLSDEEGDESTERSEELYAVYKNWPK